MLRFIFCLFIILSSNSFAKAKLHIGVIEIKPYGYYKDGKVAGLIKMLMDEIYGKDFEIKYSLFPYNRTIEYLSGGKIDITIMFKNKHVQKCCIEIDETLVAKNILVSFKDKNINSFDDIQGRPISFIRGANYGKNFEKLKVKKFQATNYEQSVKLLIKQRVDGIVISARAWEYFEKDFKLNKNDFNKLFVNQRKSSLFARKNLPLELQKKLKIIHRKFLKLKPKLSIDNFAN